MKNVLSHKFSITLFSLLILFTIITLSAKLITKSSQQEKNQPDKTVSTEKTATSSSTVKDGENSVKVNVDDKIQANQNNSSTSTSNGTCTVTKNGVTTTVPADQVKVDEHVSGEMTVKVNCENKINQSNSSQTSINNKVDVKVNSTP